MTATSVTYSGTGGLLRLVRQDALSASVGSCAHHPDPDLWFREDQSDPDFCAACTKIAVGICQTCPIRSWCAVRAEGETVGVWAGSPVSSGVDGRRGKEHSCPDGRRRRATELKRAQRARAASATG